MTAFQAALVISELMYNPAPPNTETETAVSPINSAFEYLVITNIGGDPLDLTNVRLTKGVDFDFAPGTVLASGESVFVVKNRAAFEARYGTAASGVTIAGEWDAADNLRDSGEIIRLSYGAGAVIREFAYDDKGAWPETADGAGFSLVLKDTSKLLDHAKSDSWRASEAINGSLGQIETGTGYAAWKARFAVTGDGDDRDFDGTPALGEYALGRSPRLADPSPITISTDTTGQFIELTFPWDTQAEGTSFSFRSSDNLQVWHALPADRFALVSETDQGAGIVLRHYRDTQSLRGAMSAYLQLQVSVGE